MELYEEIKSLIIELNKDKEPGSYFHSWQSNIAMAFYDEAENFCKVNKKRSLSKSAFAEVGNRAAISFLNKLINQQK